MLRKAGPIRSAAYLEHVRSHACASCQQPPPSQAHHFMEGQGGMGTKVSDLFTVALCVRCHAAWHQQAYLPLYAPNERTAEAYKASRLRSVALMYQQQVLLLASWLRATGAFDDM